MTDRRVLRYLLSRQRHACPRDELLDAFWPDVAPDVARNRLQAAVSGLRRTMRETTDLHVIECAYGGYRLNPELRVDTDGFGAPSEAVTSKQPWPATGKRWIAIAATSPRMRHEQWTLLMIAMPAWAGLTRRYASMSCAARY